jgi:hypothetical protein
MQSYVQWQQQSLVVVNNDNTMEQSMVVDQWQHSLRDRDAKIKELHAAVVAKAAAEKTLKQQSNTLEKRVTELESTSVKMRLEKIEQLEQIGQLSKKVAKLDQELAESKAECIAAAADRPALVAKLAAATTKILDLEKIVDRIKSACPTLYLSAAAANTAATIATAKVPGAVLVPPTNHANKPPVTPAATSTSTAGAVDATATVTADNMRVWPGVYPERYSEPPLLDFLKLRNYKLERRNNALETDVKELKAIINKIAVGSTAPTTSTTSTAKAPGHVSNEPKTNEPKTNEITEPTDVSEPSAKRIKLEHNYAYSNSPPPPRTDPTANYYNPSKIV